MNYLDRRHFISSLAGGGLATGLAGCTDNGSGSDDSHDSREQDDGEQEREGEIRDTRIEMSSDEYGNPTGQLTVEVLLYGEVEEQVDLVFQTVDAKVLSPETDSSDLADDDIREIERVTLSESGDIMDSGEGYTIDFMDYWEEIPEDSFSYRVGLELESRGGVNIFEVEEEPLTRYTSYQNGNEERNLSYPRTDMNTWVEDGEITYQILFAVSSRTKYYDDLPNFPIVVEHTEDLEFLDGLDDIYENDALEWRDFTETRSASGIGGVEYLESPLLQSIADEIMDTLESLNLTEDDDLYVRTAYNALGPIPYDQPWDTVSESVRVPYAEQVYRDRGGDCKAQGFAVNGILHNLGYNTSLFLYRYEDAPSNAYHHMSGGVGLDLDPETSELGAMVDESIGRNESVRHPDVITTDERSENHIRVDPSTASVGGYSLDQLAYTYEFVEGKEV